MKQALFILAVALYLVSLCACGDQKIQSKSIILSRFLES